MLVGTKVVIDIYLWPVAELLHQTMFAGSQPHKILGTA